MIARYQSVQFVPGGREASTGLDCWGLVRLVRHEVFGRALLPSYDGGRPGYHRLITQAVTDTAAAYALTPQDTPRPGSIATAWTGRLCRHVGVLVEADGRLWVMDIDEGGVSLTAPRAFAERFSRVVYYDD